MKRKLEDDLIQLAFGDLSKERAAEIEREAGENGKAAETLAAYRGMREGLLELAEVPEPQLSKERLRDALLQDGLKPKSERSSSWGWGWLAIPAAAAFAGFAFINIRNSNTGDLDMGSGTVAVVTKNNAPIVTEPFVDIAIPAPGHETGGSGRIEMEEATTVPQAASTNVRKSQRRPRGGNEGLTVAVHGEKAQEGTVEEFLKSVGASESAITEVREQQGASASTMMAPGTVAPPMVGDSGRGSAQREASPIVLIESTKSQETGAQKATEVDSTTNVVISG